LAGAKLFRWDPGHRPSRDSRIWVLVALLPWIAVGTCALASGRWRAMPVPADPATALSADQIDAIDYGGLPPDDSTVTPVAPSIDISDSAQPARLKGLVSGLETWPPGRVPDDTQAIRNLLCVAAVADLDEDPLEGSIARAVLNHLYAHFTEQRLTQSLAWIVLHPDEGAVLTDMPELGVPGDMGQEVVRNRSTLYAKKFLGRIRGRLSN
jgi:hypothetical protein